MLEIRNSFLAGISFGLLFGLFLAILFDTQYALIGGPVSGLGFGIAIYLFMTSSVVKKQTQIDNDDGKPIIHSGGANHFVKGEAVGGRLFLLTDKLHFQSHNFNIQNHELKIDLKEIKEVNIFRTIGLIPNGLSITKHDGRTEKFVVNGRRYWKNKIDKQTSDNQT